MLPPLRAVWSISRRSRTYISVGLKWDLGLFFIHTFVGVGGPEGSFLPVLVLAHPRQTDVEVFDWFKNETLSITLCFLGTLYIPFMPDRNKNHTFVTPLRTAISTICADDRPPPTTTTLVSCRRWILFCTFGLGNDLISVLWQHAAAPSCSVEGFHG